MIHRRGRGLAAVLLSAALIAASCGGDDDDEPAATEAAEASDDSGESGSDDGADDADASGASDETDDDAGGDDEGADDDAADEGAGAGDDADAEPAETAAPLEDADQQTSEGEGSGDDVEVTPGGEVTWGLSNDGTGFDTTSAVAPGSIRIISALNDSLAGLDVNGDWVPNLAESITPNDDFTQWTITMRPGLVFHDGEPVDGEAVRANLQAFKDSPTAGFSFAPVTTIETVDELSVMLTMASPWAQFPQNLVSQAGWMVSPSTIGTNDDFVGTGPFMLESWVPGDSVRVVKNPNYWRADEGLPYLDAINFKFIPEQTVRRQAFEAGDLDGFLSPGDADIVEWLDDDSVDVWIGTAGANEYLWLLNTTAPPFDDIRVRRAMAHAIDKQFIIDTFRSGLTEPANGPLNPSSRFYSENDYPQFDPAAAQALVDEYEAEVGPIEFELSIEPNPSVIEVAEVMMSFLADVGIDGTLKEIGQGQSAITAIQDAYQAFSWFQFGAPDPDREYVFFHSSGGLLNWSNLVSADIDEGLEIGRTNVDVDARREGYAQFLQALGDEVPMLWVDHLNGVEAVAVVPELRGIGVPGVLPDGGASLPMTDGVFFAWTGVWLQQ